MLKGHISLSGQASPNIWHRGILIKVAAQCNVNRVIEILCKYLQSARHKYLLAGRRINFEGLAFASKAILRQNASDHAVSQLCLPLPLTNSQILEKTLVISCIFILRPYLGVGLGVGRIQPRQFFLAARYSSMMQV